MEKDIDYKEYVETLNSMDILIEKINNDTPKEDFYIKKFIAAFDIVEAYEKRHNSIKC